MKKIIILLFIILTIFSTNTLADKGSIPLTTGINIYEPYQDALIAWNGSEEILVLSTKLYATEKTKILQILPLPNEPAVKKSSRNVLKRANEFIPQEFFNDSRQLVLRNQDKQTPAAKIKKEVVIGSHDILVVKVLNQDYFTNWVNNYLKDKGESNPQIPESLTKTINNYLNRGYNYFVFDTIEVGPEPKINQAISYHFKSKELYYPLEITKSDCGISEINLLILTDQNLINYNGIEQNRIKDKTSSVNLNYDQVAYISPNIAELFTKDIIDLEAEDKNIKLLNWSIKNNLADLDQDLLVDQNIKKLMENEFVYHGTNYIGFKKDSNYSYQVDKKLETITGEVETRMGSRMYPWQAAAVNGKVLFNAQSQKLLQNFRAEGENVTIKGYSSKQGYIPMRDPIDSMPAMVEIRDVFYVTEIIGWTPYSGIALRSDGELNNKRTYFWLEN